MRLFKSKKPAPKTPLFNSREVANNAAAMVVAALAMEAIGLVVDTISTRRSAKQALKAKKAALSPVAEKSAAAEVAQEFSATEAVVVEAPEAPAQPAPSQA